MRTMVDTPIPFFLATSPKWARTCSPTRIGRISVLTVDYGLVGLEFVH